MTIDNLKKVGKGIKDLGVLVGATAVSIITGAFAGAFQMGITITETQEKLLKDYEFGTRD